MNHNEFVAEIQRRNRVRRLAAGGLLVRRFADGSGPVDAGGVDAGYSQEPMDPRNDVPQADTSRQDWNTAGEWMDAGKTGLGQAARDFGSGNYASGAQNMMMAPIDPLNMFRNEAPQNSYDAQAPGISQQDWGGAMNGSMGQMGQAQGLADQVLGSQRALDSQMGGQAWRLDARARGEGPSIADMQMRQGMQANAANAASMAASARGVNPALAARMAGNQASTANQAMAGQAALARLAEQQQAEAQLAGVQGQRAAMLGQEQQGALQRQSNWGQIYGAQVAGQNAQNQAITEGSLGEQRIDAQTAAANTEDNRGLISKVIGGIFAKGGRVRRFEDGGDVGSFSSDFDIGNSGAWQGSMGDSGFGSESAGPGATLAYDPANMGNPTVDTSSDFAASATPEDVDAQATAQANGAAQDPTSPAKLMSSLTGAKSTDQTGKPADKNKNIFGQIWPMLLKMLIGSMMINANKKVVMPKAAGGEISPASAPRTPEEAAKAFPPGTNPQPHFWGALIGPLINMAMSSMNKEDEKPNYGGYGAGGPVPGRAVAPGDNYRNDNVPALLSAGEIVLPRSVAMGPDAPERAAGFVKGIQASREQAKQDEVAAAMPVRKAAGGMVGKPDYERLMRRQSMLAKKIAELGAELDK